MKFSCQRNVLNDALSSCSRAVDTRAAMDVLKGIMLQAEGNVLTITGSSVDISITAVIDADVERMGIIVMEAKIFSDIIRKLPDDVVTVDVNERFVAHISCCLSEFDLTALPSENYPSMPSVDGLQALTLSQAVLKKAVNDTVFAVSDSDTRSVHTGVLFDLEPGRLTLVALDGHRLALARESIENDAGFSFVVPSSSLREVERMMLEDEEAIVTLHCSERHVLFSLGHITVVSRLLEGEFLKYKNALPQSNTFAVIISRRELLDSVERVSLLINEKLKNPVKFSFDRDVLKLSSISGLGQAQDSCQITIDEKQTLQTLEVGFNHRYVIDALRHLDSDNVLIETSGSIAPCLFLPQEDESRLYMVLPVRLTTA